MSMSELMTSKIKELEDLEKDLKKELSILDKNESSEDNTRDKIKMIQAIAEVGCMLCMILEYQLEEEMSEHD